MILYRQYPSMIFLCLCKFVALLVPSRSRSFQLVPRFSMYGDDLIDYFVFLDRNSTSIENHFILVSLLFRFTQWVISINGFRTAVTLCLRYEIFSNTRDRKYTFSIRNQFIKNSSQIGLLTQETNLLSLIFLRNSKKICVRSRSESSFSFTINIKHPQILLIKMYLTSLGHI